MIIYTDGSCRNNGFKNSEGGYGVVVCNDNNVLIDCYQHFEKDTTNNRQELKAILYTLIKYGKNKDVKVYCDSAYCVNSLTKWLFGWVNNNWRKSNKQQIENLDLFQAYYNLICKGYEINLFKVKGHNNILGNELADYLATNKTTKEDIIKKYGGKKI